MFGEVVLLHVFLAHALTRLWVHEHQPAARTAMEVEIGSLAHSGRPARPAGRAAGGRLLVPHAIKG